MPRKMSTGRDEPHEGETEMTIKSLSAAFVLAIVLAFASTLAWPPSSSASMTRGKKLSPEITAGLKAAEAGDYDAAVEILSEAIKSDPTSADARFILGYSYRELGNVDAAFKYYRAALGINRNHRDVHEHIGKLYLEGGKLEEARGHLAKLGKLCTY